MLPVQHATSRRLRYLRKNTPDPSFILVPGIQFGDETKWIVRAASMITKSRHKSVTVLVNGGKISQIDVEADRPLIVISGAGRLADEIASHPAKNPLV